MAKREVAIIIKELIVVETLFNKTILADVTEATEEASYEKIYLIYLNFWNRALHNLACRNLKIAMPNKTYFAECYAPKNATE